MYLDRSAAQKLVVWPAYSSVPVSRVSSSQQLQFPPMFALTQSLHGKKIVP